MVQHLLRAEIPARRDPHDWNSWDHYRTIHDSRISEHPFVVRFQDTLDFHVSENGLVNYLAGVVYCDKGVILEVEKWFHNRWFGNTHRVRCHTYAYIGWVRGGHLLLKYHNLHKDRDEYHHRIYDLATGDEVVHEVLERYQFPVFSEVRDELEYLSRDL